MFLTDNTISERFKPFLEKRSGIYVLYYNKKLYNVGIAQNLFKRLNDHLNDKHKGKWNKFSACIIHKKKYIKEVESILHRLAEPSSNEWKGKFKEHHKLDREIKKMLNELKRTGDRITRFYDKN
ncbi:hypothetical protein CL615_01355 [archaeon]|mgnify:CR=1 FL=1|jgi:hypothetical protein|nr:hypothetical protein [archaeon]|tara:strand:+ start:233 stop:604 length:372 start_codon:yes stop_codon:yes gene_type:complete